MASKPANPDTVMSEKPQQNTVDLVEDPGDDIRKPGDEAFEAAAQGQATTGFETLTLWETVKTFRIATLVCFAAAFSAATDGYQIGYGESSEATV